MMVTVPVQAQVCMCGLPIHWRYQGNIRLWHHNYVQERNGPICSDILCCEMDVWVYTVNMLQETFLLCSIYDHTSVIHIPLPTSWRVPSCVDGLGLKILHIEVGHNGADGRPHGCSLELFKEPALKLEIGGL